MKFNKLLALACVASIPLVAAAQDDLAQRVKYSSKEMTQRLEEATRALADTRARIASERIPMVETMRKLENTVYQEEAELLELSTRQAQVDNEIERLESDWGKLDKNLRYINSLAADALKNLNNLLLPGEDQIYGDSIDALMFKLSGSGEQLTLDDAETATAVLIRRLETMIGGYATEGKSLFEGDNNLREGRFAYIGPEAFFMSSGDKDVGTLRQSRDAAFPTAYELGGWSTGKASLVFQGEEGAFLSDVTGGKALRLQEARGDWKAHVKKGGIVGYVILGLGAFALFTALIKWIDLRNLALDGPLAVRQFLHEVSKGSLSEAKDKTAVLTKTTRQIFDTGLQCYSYSKELLEERLFAVILQMRLQHERRLPLLKVIAAAAPLLGLLGTVVGMVKTFTLVTIFGTGNASKLSSGISEALVTTELGLIVAIPSLVIHGYLSQRSQRNVARIEQYTVDFVNAVEERKSKPSS